MSSSSTDAVRPPPIPDSGAIQVNKQSLPVIITLILLSFFFLGFFSIYFVRCVLGLFIRRGNADNSAINSGVKSQGLDPSILSSFPTFVYSAVKTYQPKLECAVCLSEFEDSDVLRSIPICCHAFHPECIGLWLESHTTCPVCRRNLDPSEKLLEKSPETNVAGSDTTTTHERENHHELRDDHDHSRDSHVIFVNEGHEDDLDREEEEGDRERRRREDVGVSGDLVGRDGDIAREKFSRSHSTGHSIKRGNDRFTLRLPEHIKERIFTRGHNSTVSCITFAEFSSDIAAGKDGSGEPTEFSDGGVTRV